MKKLLLICLASALTHSYSQTTGFEKFSKVSLVPEYAPILSRANIVLVNGGGKIIWMLDGSMWVVGVGVTVVKSEGGPMEVLRQLKVATAKAHAAAVQEMKGSEVESASQSTSSSSVTVHKGQESGSSTDTTNDKVTTHSEGTTHGMEQAGTWYSANGDMFYLAMCQRLK